MAILSGGQLCPWEIFVKAQENSSPNEHYPCQTVNSHISFDRGSNRTRMMCFSVNYICCNKGYSIKLKETKIIANQLKDVKLNVDNWVECSEVEGPGCVFLSIANNETLFTYADKNSTDINLQLRTCKESHNTTVRGKQISPYATDCSMGPIDWLDANPNLKNRGSAQIYNTGVSSIDSIFTTCKIPTTDNDGNYHPIQHQHRLTYIQELGKIRFRSILKHSSLVYLWVVGKNSFGRHHYLKLLALGQNQRVKLDCCL